MNYSKLFEAVLKEMDLNGEKWCLQAIVNGKKVLLDANGKTSKTAFFMSSKPRSGLIERIKNEHPEYESVEAIQNSDLSK